MSEQPDMCFWGEGDNNKPHHMMGHSSSAESDAAIVPSEEVVPDCLGKLLGVRCFILCRPWSSSEHKRDDRLYSLFHEYMWTPGKEEHAVCLYHTAPHVKGLVAPREHASPDGRCGCGLYAYYDYWEAWRGTPRRDRFTIFAVVSGWGDIEEHESGFRSEYMEIEALVGPSASIIRRRKARKTIERFAEIYKVPVIWNPQQVHCWMDDFAGGVRLKNQK